jgi:hypothetical protein
LPQVPLAQPLPPGSCGTKWVIEVFVIATMFSAAATGAAKIAVAAAPAMSSGDMNFSLAIMLPVYHGIG